MATGASVHAEVDAVRREAIRRAHSATHMLHHALQKNLGSHAQQQGSKVDDDWLRFDFSNLSPVSPEQLEGIERDVRDRVQAGESIQWKVLPLAEARTAGAMMLFGEKYPDPVRMVTMGTFSRELCGGTHLTNTGQVGDFEIITEEGVAANTRRVVALTGLKAARHVQQTQEAADSAAGLLQVAVTALPDAVQELGQIVRDLKKQLGGGSGGGPAARGPATRTSNEPLTYPQQRAALRAAAKLLNVGLFEVPDRIRGLQAEVAALREQLAAREEVGAISAADLLARAEVVKGIKVVIADLPLSNSNLMRQLIDQIRKTASPCAIFLASAEGDDKVTLVAGLSRDLVDRKLSAGQWVKEVAPVVGGGGGGKPDMAQAGGKQPEKLPAAIQKARAWITASL
jgi:alanyl-tRNA synthetase